MDAIGFRALGHYDVAETILAHAQNALTETQRPGSERVTWTIRDPSQLFTYKPM
jgi:hypothetical protein